MSRLVLYRKYRSADFVDVIGQDHITRTLETAVKTGLLSHAYLFTGPRGVGKTSVARIMARNLNALNPSEDIAQYLDIIEIDAASNRGIDEIRALREKVAVAPTTLKYKVYIIDEVHMLTKEAFNALLKTLEEPPSHVVFILATTDAHKLPDTIISRTQRFDFRPIAPAAMVDHLATIAKKEKINITTDALQAIAQVSKGGFRDAISVLDQLSVGGAKVDKTHIYSLFGMSSDEVVAEVVRAVLESNSQAALQILTQAIDQGSDPTQLTQQMLDYLRQGLFTRSDRDSQDESVESVDLRDVSLERLVGMIDNLIKALADFKVTAHRSLPLELAVFKSSLAAVPSQPSAAVGQSASSNQTTAVSRPVKATSDKKKDQHINVDNASLCTKGLSLIKERNNSLYAVMRSASPRVEGDELILDCRFRFHKERIEEAKNRSLIEAVMKKTFGREINLRCDLVNNDRAASSSDKDSELISSALEILGGEIING